MGDTVDGRNPAPVDMENNPCFIGFHRSQVERGFLPSTVSGMLGMLNMIYTTPV